MPSLIQGKDCTEDSADYRDQAGDFAGKVGHSPGYMGPGHRGVLGHKDSAGNTDSAASSPQVLLHTADYRSGYCYFAFAASFSSRFSSGKWKGLSK